MGGHDIIHDYWMLLPVIEEINTVCSVWIRLLCLYDTSKEGCLDLSLAEEVVDAG